MGRFFKAVIRASAFVLKEIFEILRQPRLLLTLVLGPFLILLIFGIGYRNEARKLRTLFVIQKDSPLNQRIESFASNLGPQLIYEGTTPDQAAALDKLRRGEVDLVAVAPDNPYQTIQSNHQAVFTLYHNEIDPFQVSYVKYFGEIYIEEINRRVLLAITEEGQNNATTLQQDLKSAKENAKTLHQALQAGDALSARQSQLKLEQNVNDISLVLGGSLSLLQGVENTFGASGANQAKNIMDTLTQIQQSIQDLNNLDLSQANSQQQAQKISDVEDRLSNLESLLNQFTHIDAYILIRPFRTETKSVARLEPSASDFFVPAVIALLLQHLAVTFGALSIVREHTVGTMELFRVSPLSAGEILFGKYLSYLFFGGILTAVLTLLLLYGLHVPMLGAWLDYGLVIAALIFTSLGIGFIISLISQNDSQAVQYTMIVLLTSVFFSGFLMRLDTIIQPVRILSWSLPTTYGIIMLRDIFLRGQAPDPFLLGGLTLIGVGLCLVAWRMLHRSISAQ